MLSRGLIQNTPSFKRLAGIHIWILFVKAALIKCFFTSSSVPVDSVQHSKCPNFIYDFCHFEYYQYYYLRSIFSKSIFHFKLLYITSMNGKHEIVFLLQREGNIKMNI